MKLYNIVIVGIAVLFICTCLCIRGMNTNINELKKEIRKEKTEQLDTLDKCFEQTKLVEEKRWEISKDRWLKISDINDACYKSIDEEGVYFGRKNWRKLVREKSQPSPMFYYNETSKASFKDIEISYTFNKDDLISALKEVADINE